MNIAVFASHNGSDMQALVNGCKSGEIDGRVCVVISNNNNAYVLEKAKKENINNYCVNISLFPEDGAVDKKILKILQENKIDIIFLAGYLKKIGVSILKKYKNRIFNIHPALIPKFGGKGMYGINVHEAVIEAKENVSGITVHRVNEEYDSGEIVAQCKVNVLIDDTPEILAERILQKEHIFIIDVMNDIVQGKIKVGL